MPRPLRIRAAPSRLLRRLLQHRQESISSRWPHIFQKFEQKLVRTLPRTDEIRSSRSSFGLNQQQTPMRYAADVSWLVITLTTADTSPSRDQRSDVRGCSTIRAARPAAATFATFEYRRRSARCCFQRRCGERGRQRRRWRSGGGRRADIHRCRIERHGRRVRLNVARPGRRVTGAATGQIRSGTGCMQVVCSAERAHRDDRAATDYRREQLHARPLRGRFICCHLRRMAWTAPKALRWRCEIAADVKT
jgi:hypothetical protein